MVQYTPLPPLVDGHAHSHRWRRITATAEPITAEALDSVAKLSRLAVHLDDRNRLVVLAARLRHLERIWQQAK